MAGTSRPLCSRWWDGGLEELQAAVRAVRAAASQPQAWPVAAVASHGRPLRVGPPCEDALLFSRRVGCATLRVVSSPAIRKKERKKERLDLETLQARATEPASSRESTAAAASRLGRRSPERPAAAEAAEARPDPAALPVAAAALAAGRRSFGRTAGAALHEGVGSHACVTATTRRTGLRTVLQHGGSHSCAGAAAPSNNGSTPQLRLPILQLTSAESQS
jgi:hypothetical protein